MTFIVFILILSILVLVHEFGHFITAKKSGIKVEEFGLGIPPRAIGKKIGDTIYSLNWLPFGGFVKLYGEDSSDPLYLKDTYSFISKPWYTRMLVITAGVLMNFLLSIVLYYIFFSFNNFRTFTLPVMFDHDFAFGSQVYRDTVILGFAENSFVGDAGIGLGDTILKVNDVDVKTVEDIKYQTSLSPKSVQLLVEKYPSSEIKTYTVTPILNDKNEPVLGVYLGKSLVIHYDTPTDKLLVGFLHTYNMLSYSVDSLGSLFSQSIKERNMEAVSQNVSGPVGIYNVVGGIIKYSSDKLFLSLLDFTALLSISLGFLNILPIPALDGGRLVFVLIELVRGGKKISQSLEAKIHGFGMFVLLGLFVLITIKDVLG